jgi:hypothetical protein
MDTCNARKVEEVLVQRKDSPTAREGDSADQKVDWRTDYALRTAGIADFGRRFKIGSVNRRVLELS